MSHVRRKRPRQPGRLAHRREDKRAWKSFWLMTLIMISVIAAIVLLIMSQPK